MACEWFRSWHGAPTDPKWRTVAKRAGVRPGDVAAVVWLLLDRASQADKRGSIEGYDAEVLADALGYEASDVIGIISALHDKGVLVNSVFSGWERYQPKREDSSTERTREWRNRRAENSGKREIHEENQQTRDATEQSVTHGDAAKHNVTLDTDTDTDTDKKDISQPSVARPKQVRTRKAYPEDFEAFWKAYPTDPNQSKAEALAAWQRLGEEDRKQAIASVPAFVAYCQKDPTYRPIHACRFLTKRRFEGHATGPPVQPTVYTLPPLKILTDAELEAQMLAREAEEDARNQRDELSARGADNRKVSTA